MKSPEIVRQAFALRAAGMTQRQIADELDLGQSTVSRWLQRGEFGTVSKHRMDHAGGHCPTECPRKERLDTAAYAYLLGQYLGDGWITEGRRRVFRLYLFCCAAYPNILEECAAAMRAVVPGGAVTRQRRPGIIALSVYSKHWPCLFPQHGAGMKHTRQIELEPWQSQIALVDHPEQFVRGLIHSDGCRCMNRVKGQSGRRYVYPRYLFSNASSDIRWLFCDACDALGIEWRRMNARNISIARRESVALLDEIVGPKS
jgi:hypothetical protein